MATKSERIVRKSSTFSEASFIAPNRKMSPEIAKIAKNARDSAEDSAKDSSREDSVDSDCASTVSSSDERKERYVGTNSCITDDEKSHGRSVKNVSYDEVMKHMKKMEETYEDITEIRQRLASQANTLLLEMRQLRSMLDGKNGEVHLVRNEKKQKSLRVRDIFRRTSQDSTKQG